MLTSDKIIEIFVGVDNFCQEFETEIVKHQLDAGNYKIRDRKRAIIECVNDELKNICKLQHTRHRSVNNFLMNTMGALCAYAFFPKKPSLNIVFETNNNQLLLAD
jgi:hypothetical protein